MFAERKDAIEMALGIALLVTCLRYHWYLRKVPASHIVGELALLLVTFNAVLLILFGTW